MYDIGLYISNHHIFSLSSSTFAILFCTYWYVMRFVWTTTLEWFGKFHVWWRVNIKYIENCTESFVFMTVYVYTQIGRFFPSLFTRNNIKFDCHIEEFFILGLFTFKMDWILSRTDNNDLNFSSKAKPIQSFSEAIIRFHPKTHQSMLSMSNSKDGLLVSFQSPPVLNIMSESSSIISIWKSIFGY